MEKLYAKHFTVSTICISPPIVYLLPDALQHVLCNICNCCSDLGFEFTQNIHSLAVHPVFHITSKEKVQRHNIRGMMESCIWFSSSCPSIWEIHVGQCEQKRNRLTVHLKNRVVVVAAAAAAAAAAVEPWKGIILQHISEQIACNDVLIKEKWPIILSGVSVYHMST
jgi:hypothetical protein